MNPQPPRQPYPAPPPGHYGYPPPTVAGYPPPGYHPPPRRRTGCLVFGILGGLVAVVLVAAGIAWFGFLGPQARERQLEQAYEDLEFGPTGFVPEGDPPVIVREPYLHVLEVWVSDALQEEHPDFVERAVDSLQNWSYNNGFPITRDVLTDCFAEHCVHQWNFGSDYLLQFSIAPSEFAPRWTITLSLE